MTHSETKPPAANWRRVANKGGKPVHLQFHCTTGEAKSQPPDGEPVRNAQGRVVGRIENGWLTKRGLDCKKHQAYRPRGWATDAAHLDIPGLVGVRLHTTDGEVWEASLEQFREHGIAVDWGFGAQVVLPVRFWAVTRPGEVQARQLALVGV